MPIYEYECEKCGSIEEVLQKFSDTPLVKCKQCSGKLHRLISHSSFHLKGSGWYVTDYTSKSKSCSAPPKTTADAPTKKPDESKKAIDKTS